MALLPAAGQGGDRAAPGRRRGIFPEPDRPLRGPQEAEVFRRPGPPELQDRPEHRPAPAPAEPARHPGRSIPEIRGRHRRHEGGDHRRGVAAACSRCPRWSRSSTRPSPTSPPAPSARDRSSRTATTGNWTSCAPSAATPRRSSPPWRKSEKAATGIPSLKIKYNKVFGYFIEVTNSHLQLVPEHYIRKQTLVNAERFLTAELKELEEKILKAEEKIVVIEKELFLDVLAEIQRFSAQLNLDADLDRRAGRPGRRRRAGPAPRLRAPGDQRRHGHPHPGRAPPGHRGRLGPRLHSQRPEHLLGQRADPDHHRPEHGRQVDLSCARTP